MTLHIVPCTLTTARWFVAKTHRHAKPPAGGNFAVAVEGDGTIRGVAIVGRPVARLLQDGFTAEVTRLATDGTRNACSILYAACWRAARAMGYRRIITYTLSTEPGTSLTAAGWRDVADVEPKHWTCPSRPRKRHPVQRKIRWEVEL